MLITKPSFEAGGASGANSAAFDRVLRSSRKNDNRTGASCLAGVVWRCDPGPGFRLVHPLIFGSAAGRHAPPAVSSSQRRPVGAVGRSPPHEKEFRFPSP